jgi:hypothetical protein
MWSPQTGFLALPILLAAAWPIVRNNAAAEALGVASTGDASTVLWGESVTLAVVLGFLSGLVTRDLFQTPFAFVVPNLRRRIFLGKLGLAVVLAGALAFRLSTISGLKLAPAIASCSILFFVLGAALSDPVFPRSAVWIVGPLLVVPVWDPHQVQRFFEFVPEIGTIAALSVATVLAIRELDPDTARLRTLGQTKNTRPLRWGPARTLRRAVEFAQKWHGSPKTGELSQWVQAVHYENFGARRLEWPTGVLWAVGLNCGTAYALKNPGFAALMGLMNLSMGGHRLTGRWAYPIARERRALILWICSLADSVAYFSAALFLLPVVYALGLPQVSMISGGTPRYGLLAPLAVAFIAAPVVQWPRVTSNLSPPKLARFGPLWISVSLRFVGAIAIMTFVLETLFVVSVQLSFAAAIATGLALAFAFQYYYWVNLRHHFAGSDLA